MAHGAAGQHQTAKGDATSNLNINQAATTVGGNTASHHATGASFHQGIAAIVGAWGAISANGDGLGRSHGAIHQHLLTRCDQNGRIRATPDHAACTGLAASQHRAVKDHILAAAQRDG